MANRIETNAQENRVPTGNTSPNTSEGEGLEANHASPAAAAQEARSAHVASNISSSMSGNAIGDMVGNKRMNLLDAMQDAKPQVGRRPTPVHDPWPRRKMVIKWIALAVLVCIIVAVLVVALAQLGSPDTVPL